MTRSSDLSSTAGAHARDLGEKVKSAVTEKVSAEAGKVQGQAAHEVQQAADAADAVAGAVDPGTVQAQAAHQVASQLEGIANQIRTADLNETVSKVSTFARENPALFIGAAALAGFAATRFLKARPPEAQGVAPTGDPWAATPDMAPPQPNARPVRHPDEDTLAHATSDDHDHHTKVATATGGSHGPA